MGRLVPLAVVGLTLLSACGGEAPEPVAPSPRLTFPPQAQEPGRVPARERPAGRVVRVGAGAEGIAVDPASGVAAVAVDAGLALVDAGTGAVRRTVRLPAPARHVSYSGRAFLVPLEEANQLAEVSPDGDVRLVDTGAHPHDAAGDVVAVVSVRANVVETYDRRTLERVSTQNVGYGPSHVVAGRDGRLFVADTRGGGVSVFSTRPRLRFEQRIDTPGKPYGIALDDDRLWVTLTDRNQLVRIEDGRVVKRYPTVATPYSVAVNPAGDVLVTGRDRGELQILSP